MNTNPVRDPNQPLATLLGGWLLAATLIGCTRTSVPEVDAQPAGARIEHLLYSDGLVHDPEVTDSARAYTLRRAKNPFGHDEAADRFLAWMTTWESQHPEKATAARQVAATDNTIRDEIHRRRR